GWLTTMGYNGRSSAEKIIDIKIRDLYENTRCISLGETLPKVVNERKVVSLHYGDFDLQQKNIDSLESALSVAGYAASIGALIAKIVAPSLSAPLGAISLLLGTYTILREHTLTKYSEEYHQATINNLNLGYDKSCYGFMWFRIVTPSSGNVEFNLNFDIDLYYQGIFPSTLYVFSLCAYTKLIFM
ncbi:MAG: hypothetical protein Q6363_005635, partial [Candidatus Njordarchaeota archaeon]